MKLCHKGISSSEEITSQGIIFKQDEGKDLRPDSFEIAAAAAARLSDKGLAIKAEQVSRVDRNSTAIFVIVIAVLGCSVAMA